MWGSSPFTAGWYASAAAGRDHTGGHNDTHKHSLNIKPKVVVFFIQLIVDPILRTFEGSIGSASESGTQEEATVSLRHSITMKINDALRENGVNV